MSTIKSSNEHLTLNADGSSKDIKFQANGVEKASIDSSGNLTVSGNLTSVGIDDNADATAMTINSSERVGIGDTTPEAKLEIHAGSETGLHVQSSVAGEVTAQFKGAGTGNVTVMRALDSGGTALFDVKQDGRGLSQFTAKAWCNWNGTGTVAIRDSFNVSSVSDYGTGHYAPTYGTSMANTNYGVYACGSFNSSNRDRHVSGRVQNAGSAECLSQAGSTATDNADCYVLVFGD